MAIEDAVKRIMRLALRVSVILGLAFVGAVFLPRDVRAFTVSAATSGWIDPSDDPSACGGPTNSGRNNDIQIDVGASQYVPFCLTGTADQDDVDNGVLVQVWDDDPGLFDLDDELASRLLTVSSTGTYAKWTTITLSCDLSGHVVNSQGEASVQAYFEIDDQWPYYGYGRTQLAQVPLITCVCPDSDPDCLGDGTGVGGIAELPALSGTSAGEAAAPAAGSGWSAGGYAALAGGVAAAAVALCAGAWYARRRWLR
jgi:hypothetical protein